MKKPGEMKKPITDRTIPSAFCWKTNAITAAMPVTKKIAVQTKPDGGFKMRYSIIVILIWYQMQKEIV